jgi:hypothetical protein
VSAARCFPPDTLRKKFLRLIPEFYPTRIGCGDVDEDAATEAQWCGA